MVDEKQIIPLLLEASPSFQAAWEEHCRDNGDDLKMEKVSGTKS